LFHLHDAPVPHHSNQHRHADQIPLLLEGEHSGDALVRWQVGAQPGEGQAHRAAAGSGGPDDFPQEVDRVVRGGGRLIGIATAGIAGAIAPYEPLILRCVG
jgi:hypothetical protein